MRTTAGLFAAGATCSLRGVYIMPYKEKDGRWRAVIKKNGNRSTKFFNTKKEAKAWETSVKSGKLKQETNIISLAELAVEYLSFAKAKYADKTYSEKAITFKRFFSSVNPDISVFEFANGKGRRMMLKYVTGQKEARSGYAANKDRKNLVAAWNWGIKYLDLPTNNPFLVEKMAEIRQPRYVPPEADFWKVYEACAPADKVLLLTFLHTAARRSELFRLTWADIDFPNQTIRLSTRKRLDSSMEYDVLPMTDELTEALSGHFKGSNSFNVFVSENDKNYVERIKFMPKICKKAGIKPFGYHAIRHLTATTLYHNGCDLATIQAILRHKSPSTTERYLKTLGVTKVKTALNSLTNIMSFNPERKKEKDTYRDTHPSAAFS